MSFVFLHGMGGSPADWDEIRKILPGEALPLPSSAASFADLISSFADSLMGRENLVLCGYSMGGRIGVLLAAEMRKRGEPVTGLALMGSGMGFSGEGERSSRLAIDEEWAKLAARDADKFWADWYQQPLFASFSALPPLVRVKWLQSRKSMNSSALVRQLRNFGPAVHADLTPLLEIEKKAGISVLYLAGELDKKYLTLGQKLSETLGVHMVSIQGAGHILPLEAPEQVANQLSSFFPSAT